MRDDSFYVPVHLGIHTSRKLVELSIGLKRSPDACVGLLTRLWGIGIQHADDGRLVGWSARVLGEALGFKGSRAEHVVGLFEQCGWLNRLDDGTLALHEWDLYTGRGIDARRKERDKKRAQRDAKHQKANKPKSVHMDVPGTVPGRPRDVTPPNGNGNGNGNYESESGDSPQLKPSADPQPTQQSGPKRARSMGRGVMGLAEVEMAPKSPEELSQQLHLARRFPALDGENGRPALLDEVRARWQNFQRKLANDGLAAALAAFPGWLADGYDRHRRAWERDGNVDVGKVASIRYGPPPTPELRPLDDDEVPP